MTDELETVLSAFYLENSISDLQTDADNLKRPKKPTPPSQPELKGGVIAAEPYPEIHTQVSVPFPNGWRNGVFIAGGGLIATICSPVLIGMPFLGVILALVGVAAIPAGLLYAAYTYLSDRKRHKQEVEYYTKQQKESIANSPEYRAQCAEVDARNKKRQDELDAELNKKYSQECEEYNVALSVYNKQLSAYHDSVYPEYLEEYNSLQNALRETKQSLRELYDRNILPQPYRNVPALMYLATFLSTSKYDLKFAIERYDTYVIQKAQQQQISISAAQLSVAREIMANTTEALWLGQQGVQMQQDGNDTLRSISNWQKTDFVVREYRNIKEKRAAKKAAKGRKSSN